MDEEHTQDYPGGSCFSLEPPPGNERIARNLSGAVRSGKVHHAYLFEGPSGVGKSQMSTWFSSLLFCEGSLIELSDALNGATILPCGDCSSCRLHRKGEHPDFEQVGPADGRNKIVIDQIREVIRHTIYRPLKSSHRVIEFRSADKMDAVPANALLKTLEEPATYNTFILISDRAHSLLDTIRSRCQNVRFSSLDPQIVAQLLESEGLGARDAHILASACGGSTTNARALNELGFVLQAEEWLDRYLSPLSQVVFTPGDVVNEVAQLSTNHRRSPDPGNGEIALLFRTLRLGLRDAILVGQGLAPERLTWPERYESALALYRALDAGPLIKLMERIADASQLFDRPLNTTLILEDLLLRVLAARRRASRQVA